LISSYLYQLFVNAPVFKIKEEGSEHFKSHLEKEVNRARTDLGKQIDTELIDFLIASQYSELTSFFTKNPLLEIFYLVNSFHEYKQNNEAYDELGRFKYIKSIQFNLGIQKNQVLFLMFDLVGNDPEISRFLTVHSHKSYFYLSHDIDSVHGALLQDGAWALKNGRMDVILKLIFNTVMQRPDWLNMDLIMKTVSEKDFVSTFYWLVNQGKIDERQTNSDYNIHSTLIKKNISEIEKKGFKNGLHKSISKETFAQELLKTPFKTKDNRYHYLKFKLPEAYQSIEEAGLETDASLGFAEHYGFRNSYGYPFHPYNTEKNQAFSFLEIPLNVMDGTFQRYMKIPVNETANQIIRFLEENSQNALLSILWHNTFFSSYKYKGYLDEYKKVLDYLYQNKFKCLSLDQINQEFRWKTK